MLPNVVNLHNNNTGNVGSQSAVRTLQHYHYNLLYSSHSCHTGNRITRSAQTQNNHYQDIQIRPGAVAGAMHFAIRRHGRTSP